MRVVRVWMRCSAAESRFISLRIISSSSSRARLSSLRMRATMPRRPIFCGDGHLGGGRGSLPSPLTSMSSAWYSSIDPISVCSRMLPSSLIRGPGSPRPCTRRDWSIVFELATAEGMRTACLELFRRIVWPGLICRATMTLFFASFCSAWDDRRRTTMILRLRFAGASAPSTPLMEGLGIGYTGSLHSRSAQGSGVRQGRSRGAFGARQSPAGGGAGASVWWAPTRGEGNHN
mmetsp:Transcript_2400/g.4633  ORF Transcript_2400/g.4633 Transcript_2400/m.4633 type:complete len:232 (-) Transcript_2400:16-711(-)